MNTFARAIALILTVLMVAILPMRYMAINQAAIMDSRVDKETKEFADDIMTRGYLSLDMYDNFCNQLAVTDQLYDIDLIHSKAKQIFDVGSSERLEEIDAINETLQATADKSRADKLSFMNVKKTMGKEILSLNYNISSRSASLNNHEQKDNSTFSLASHTHTDDCYANHRHNSNCFPTGYMGGEVYVRNFPSSTSNSLGISFYCARCNGLLSNINAQYDLSNYYGQINIIYYTFDSNGKVIEKNIRNIATSNTSYQPKVAEIIGRLWGSIAPYSIQNSSKTGNFNFITTLGSYWWYSTDLVYHTMPFQGCPYCGKFGENYSCGLQEDVTPICNQVVTSITATNPVQTIKKGESIITTATATFLDGHTGTVTCSNNFNPNQVGTQTVTLTYNGKVGNAKTTGTLTCTLLVTVQDNSIPKELLVIPSSYTVYNGSEPTYKVEVIYEDRTRKEIIKGYTKIGFTEGAGTKEVTFTYTENSKTVTTTIIILVKRNVKTCINGHIYELDDFDTDLGCAVCNETIESIIVAPDTITVGKGSVLDITVTATYQDNHTAIIPSGWTSNFDNSQLGEQQVTIEYMGKTADITVTVEDKVTCPICGNIYTNDETNPGCPICSRKVVSITATPNTQTVPAGGDIAIEVEALYQDGHKAIVSDWTSDFNPFRIGSQVVNISYESASTTVTIIVESGTDITCPICGTTYSMITNPNGCPVCSVKIDHIEARLRSEGTKVQLGSELNLYIIVSYKDNHKEKAYGEWEVEGYNPDVLGEQTLTIKYKGFETQLTIEVINSLAKVTCPNGHVYYLNEDGSDPGCPYCNIDEISGTSYEYMECIYTVDILDELNTKGVYELEKGDCFTVEVHRKTTSVYDKLKTFIFKEHAETKKYTYGGMVNN